MGDEVLKVLGSAAAKVATEGVASSLDHNWRGVLRMFHP